MKTLRRSRSAASNASGQRALLLIVPSVNFVGFVTDAGPKRPRINHRYVKTLLFA
ncbi:hypothetical protein E1H18_165 [Caulobacter sp. RHG1]|nr:hypothetical protein [Caulobacter sp. RHG1]